MKTTTTLKNCSNMKNQHYEREDIKATDIANNQIPYKHKNSFIFKNDNH